jgi:hypothetical protein
LLLQFYLFLLQFVIHPIQVISLKLIDTLILITLSWNQFLFFRLEKKKKKKNIDDIDSIYSCEESLIKVKTQNIINRLTKTPSKLRRNIKKHYHLEKSKVVENSLLKPIIICKRVKLNRTFWIELSWQESEKKKKLTNNENRKSVYAHTHKKKLCNYQWPIRSFVRILETEKKN